MFDPKLYRNACDKMTLDAEKMEEMILMTENTNQAPVRRPARVMLVAAALAAALGITASAAEIPAVREFFTTMFITVSSVDPELDLALPSVAVEDRDGRKILLVNEDEVDVTDALTQKGEYLYKGDGFQVAVDEKGVAVVTAYGTDGMTVTYSTEAGTESGVVYHAANEDEAGYHDYNILVDVEGADALNTADTDAMGSYNIVTDESGALCITPATEKEK